jgi:hypothetical protein
VKKRNSARAVACSIVAIFATSCCFSIVYAKEKESAAPTFLLALKGDTGVELKLNGKPFRFLVDPDAPGSRFPRGLLDPDI